jgi:hypothetical protein
MTPAKTISPYAAKRRAQKLKAIADRRALRRRPTRHALVCRALIHAQMLPSPVGGGLTADEHRKLRNQLKAMRRSRR